MSCDVLCNVVALFSKRLAAAPNVEIANYLYVEDILRRVSGAVFVHYFDCAMLGVSLECKVKNRRRNMEKYYLILLLRPVVKKCCARLLKSIDVGKLEETVKRRCGGGTFFRIAGERVYFRVAAKRLPSKCCRGVLQEFCKGGSEGHGEVLGLLGSEGCYCSLGVGEDSCREILLVC